VEAITLLNERGEPIEAAAVGARVTLRVQVRLHAPVDRLVLGYMIKDRLGQAMYGTNTHHMQRPLEALQAGELITYHFTFPANFGPGSYSVTTALTSSDNHLLDNYQWRDLALMFTVANIEGRTFVGCNWLEPVIEIMR
jgi:lipopolysaccharide transport system ATP-binding protein